MLFIYLLSYIVGTIIGLILYGKVPYILILIISAVIGWMIGFIYNRINQIKY